jgi:hypothetical protein
MKRVRIDNLEAFLRELGGLHDAWISNVFVDAEQRALMLTIDDINANFEGLPEYKQRPAILEFEAVTHVALDIDLSEGLMISSADVTRDGDFFQLEISMSAGYWRTETPIIAKFKSLTVIEPTPPT